MFSPASAHTIMTVDNIEIDVGWQEEPPVVGLLNAITIEVSEIVSEGVRTGITNAFKDMTATAKFGGVEKQLNINSDPRPGHYFSKILPTRTGTITVELSGEVDGIPVNLEIPIEDVETQASLAFPTTGGSSDQDVTALKNAMSSMQRDLIEIKSKAGNSQLNSEDGGATYDLAVFGLTLGAAGVILAVIAMTKLDFKIMKSKEIRLK
jgi:hypothetical protein